jgi:hypothetical protein
MVVESFGLLISIESLNQPYDDGNYAIEHTRLPL